MREVAGSYEFGTRQMLTIAVRSLSLEPPASIRDAAALSAWMQALPTAIRPYYWSAAANPTIRLGNVNLTIRAGGLAEQLPALVSLGCQPSPRIVYETLEEVGTELFFATLDKGVTVDVQPVLRVPGRPERIRLPTHPFVGSLPHFEVGSGEALVRVRFLLFNFADTASHVIRSKASIRSGRLIVASERWLVLMDGVHDLSARLIQARARGAYLPTHGCELRSVDGSPFSSDEALDVLDALHYFLSFAMGSRTGPCLLAGYRQGDRRPVWAQWGARATDPYHGPQTWFDRHQPESLNAIFGPFLEKWATQRYRKVLERVISVFIQGHDPDPIENAIVSTQIGLETLAWLIPKERPTERGTGGLIAQLLRESGVPLVIPTNLADLSAAAAAMKWSHGPHAIVEIRNDIVHAGRDHTWEQRVMVDAWRLSLWYLELTLLHWLGYSGLYNRRTDDNRMVGSVTRVPWPS